MILLMTVAMTKMMMVIMIKKKTHDKEYNYLSVQHPYHPCPPSVHQVPELAVTGHHHLIAAVVQTLEVCTTSGSSTTHTDT